MAPSSGSGAGPAGAAGARRIGSHTVNRMGLGAMRLTGTRPFHEGTPRDRRTSIAVVRRAVELGVDLIDTAAFYFSRTLAANELVRSALGDDTEHVLVATKVGPWRTPDGRWADWAEPADLRAQVEENLRQLGRDRLDLVYYRAPGPTAPVANHVAALAGLVSTGEVAAIGVSGVGPSQLVEAAEVAEIAAVQNRFAVDSRGDAEVLRWCADHDVAFIPFFSLTGHRAHQAPATAEAQPGVLGQVAVEVGATIAQVRLAWTLALGPHVVVIPGTGDPAHLEENIAAAAIRLDPDQMERLSGPVL